MGIHPGTGDASGTNAREDRLRSGRRWKGAIVSVVGSGEESGADPPKDGHLLNQRKVLVQVSANAIELPPLRLVAADLAARADFDLDTVADLRLAVDEAASELVAVGVADAPLTCVFTVDEEKMLVTAWVHARDGAKLRQDSFGWRVLTTLVDEVHATEEPGADPPLLGISLCKLLPDQPDQISDPAPTEGH
jgi:serine/threonine-protein kinase RsbW